MMMMITKLPKLVATDQSKLADLLEDLHLASQIVEEVDEVDEVDEDTLEIVQENDDESQDDGLSQCDHDGSVSVDVPDLTLDE